MFDELPRLRETSELRLLLAHYVQGSKEERQNWRDRKKPCEMIESKELTKLHGELLAYGWIEQNTGLVELNDNRTEAPCCYRVTTSGLRALRQLAEE